MAGDLLQIPEGGVEIPQEVIPQDLPIPEGGELIPLSYARPPSKWESFKQGAKQGIVERLQGLDQGVLEVENLLSSTFADYPTSPEAQQRRALMEQKNREVMQQRTEYAALPGSQSSAGKLGQKVGEAGPDLALAAVTMGRSLPATVGARLGATMVLEGGLGATYFAESPEEKLQNAVMSAIFGGAGSAGMEVFRLNANILNRVMRKANAVPDVAKYFDQSKVLSEMTGIDYTLGQATGSRALQAFENSAVDAMGASDLVVSYRNKQIAQSTKFLNDTLRKFGDPDADHAIVGAQLQQGLNDTVDKIVKVRSHLWDRYMDKADAIVGSKPIGAPSKTLGKLDEVIADLESPLAPYPQSVVNDLKKTREFSTKNWSLLEYKDALKKYGELAAGTRQPFKDLDVADQKRIYRQVVSALNEDLDAIEGRGDVAASAIQNLKAARNAWKINSQKLDGIENTVLGSALNKGGRPLSPEEFYRKIRSVPASEMKALIPMMDRADKSIMNNVRARVFNDILQDAKKEMATGTPLTDFNAADFVKNLSNYPNAKLIFDKGAAKDYLTAINGIKRIVNFGNISGSGQSPLGAATEAGGIAFGPLESGGLPNMVFVGRFLAKNLSPERYAKLLMTPEGRKAIEIVSRRQKYSRVAVISAAGVIMDTLTKPSTINDEGELIQGQVQMEPDMQTLQERVR